MNNFIFSIPTTAYFGKGQINILGATIKSHGGSKVLLAYGGGSIKQNGIYEPVFARFARNVLDIRDKIGTLPILLFLLPFF